MPWAGPVAAVMVGTRKHHGQWVFDVNPSISSLQHCSARILVAGTKEGIVLLDAVGAEVSADVFLQAVQIGFSALPPLWAAQTMLQTDHGKAILTLEKSPWEVAVRTTASTIMQSKLEELFGTHGHTKMSRLQALEGIWQEALRSLQIHFAGVQTDQLELWMSEVVRDVHRSTVIKDGTRTDGRGPTVIRDISCELSFLPGLRGSSLFNRGETQVLTRVAVIAGDRPKMATAEESAMTGAVNKHFFLSYDYPPFALNRVASKIYRSRREVGHGKLVSRSLSE